jgi:hypothetical protein
MTAVSMERAKGYSAGIEQKNQINLKSIPPE